ncbi:type VI secretion system ImpA family N-terminal domain-containing protein [Paraburkholderia xenovorans]
MSSSKRHATAKASVVNAAGPAHHDWMSPIDAASPCGSDLEYDPEFVVLSAQTIAKLDAQYGDFVGRPDPVNWSEIDRDCRRLMMRSKDMRVAVLFTRCRARLAASIGLAEGLGLLAAWLAAFPATIHPQPGVDDDRDAAFEIRMNALQALTDSDGLLSDVREIALTRSTVARLQVRDVERAFAQPRANDALAPESVTRQLEDLRIQQPDMLGGFSSALASLRSIEAWCDEHLGVYQPDFSALTRLLQRIAGDGPRDIATPVDPAVDEPLSVDLVAPAAAKEAAKAELNGMATQTQSIGAGPACRCTSAISVGRERALERIRDARHWFEQHEPSSPIPILLKRAERFVGKGYVDVLRAIPAELLQQWDSEE